MIILQLGSRPDAVAANAGSGAPNFVPEFMKSCIELVLQRLRREIKTSELRTMCLQVRNYGRSAVFKMSYLCKFTFFRSPSL